MEIRLIDWESAKICACWYDLVVLVEILIDFRSDWQKMKRRFELNVCIYMRGNEKYGITFNENPLRLLKMAYLQRTLEKKLANHLQRVLDGEKSTFSRDTLRK